MSVLPQELLRKVSTKSQDASTPTSDVPDDQRFRDLMKVEPIDDEPQDQGVFSLMEEEDNPLAEAPPPPLMPWLSQQTAEVGGVSKTALATEIQIAALFERMASAMLVMCSSQEMETTLYLDNLQFASSIFFGSSITIREFSTAPKAFNVEIAGSAAAMALLEASKPELIKSFQASRFNFSVHRIDTQIRADRPVLHRKEEHDSQNQQGGHDDN